MERISTDLVRRQFAEMVRRVLAGDRIQLTSYGKPIGVCVVPLEDAEVAANVKSAGGWLPGGPRG